MNIFLKMPKSIFIVFCFTFDLISSFLGSKLLSSFITNEPNLNFKEGLVFEFLIIVLFAPIIETLIFQFAVIELVLNYIKQKSTYYIAVLLSGSLFGISHFYNLQYTIYCFIIGIGFALMYLIAKKRKDINPILLVFLVHSFTNLIGFISNNLFNLDF